jgi:cardiolipin synthase
VILNWLAVYLLPSVGFILGIVLLSHILRERRSPTSTLAWLMAILFVPYLGVPLYLIFGGRKMTRIAATKPKLARDPLSPGVDSHHRRTYHFEPNEGIFPPTAHNHIAFLPDGEQAYRGILDAIQDARHCIFIATFILGNDETGTAIVNALTKKASEGLTVHLLLDALGCAKLRHRFLAPLQEAGGHVAFFMPMLHLPFRGRANLRNHRKIIIVDNQTAILGGMNLASEYMGSLPSPERWKDLSLLVQGPVVAHVADIFRSDWKFASKVTLSSNTINLPLMQSDCNAVTQLVASGPDVRNDSLRNEILTAIFRADRRIWIVTPYFVPDELLLEALCIASRRNVDVSILLPRKSNHRLADLVREGYLTRVQEAGAGIWLYQPHMLHAKAILVDESIVIVGSANMDMRSLLLNYEIALCIYDADAIGQMESWMLSLKADCCGREMKTKSVFGLIESVGRLLAPLL